MISQKRVTYLDDLRAIATISVIILHVSTANWYGYVGTYPWTIFTIYTSILRFCVPVFIMISGSLFLKDTHQINIKKLYLNNIFKLCVFLLFWSFIYQIYNLSFDMNLSVNLVKKAFINIIKGDTQVHLWYIYITIGLYIAAPIVKVFTQNATKKQLQYAIIIFLFSIQSKPLFLLTTVIL